MIALLTHSDTYRIARNVLMERVYSASKKYVDSAAASSLRGLLKKFRGKRGYTVHLFLCQQNHLEHTGTQILQ